MEEKSLLDVLNAASKVDVSNLDNVLSTVSKYEKIIDKFLNLYTKLEKSGVINAMLRIAGKRAGVDLDKPTIHPLSVVAASPQHKVLFDMLNNISPQDAQNLQFMLIQNANQNNRPTHKESEKDSQANTQDTQREK